MKYYPIQILKNNPDMGIGNDKTCPYRAITVGDVISSREGIEGDIFHHYEF